MKKKQHDAHHADDIGKLRKQLGYELPPIQQRLGTHTKYDVPVSNPVPRYNRRPPKAS